MTSLQEMLGRSHEIEEVKAAIKEGMAGTEIEV